MMVDYNENEQGESDDTQLTSEEAKVQETEATEAAEKQEHLEAGVEERMAKIRGDEPTPESELEGDPESTPEPDPKPDSEPTPDEDPAGKEDGKAGDLADEGKSEGDESAGDENALTAAEIRAALHAEWTDEEITELSKENPALAKRTCAKLLETMNNTSKIFSEAGKKLKDAAPAVSEPESEPKSSVIKPIDLSTLEAEYKDEAIFPVIKQLADQNAALANQVSDSQAAAATAKAETREAKAAKQEDAATDQQLETFFTGESILEYEGFYGKTTNKDENWDHITQGQMNQRMKVVEQARLILAGAESQGVEISLADALERAHLTAVAPVQEEIIRSKITKQLKTREKGITLKPGTGTKIVVTGGKPSRSQLEALTEQRLAKIRSKTFG